MSGTAENPRRIEFERVPMLIRFAPVRIIAAVHFDPDGLAISSAHSLWTGSLLQSRHRQEKSSTNNGYRATSLHRVLVVYHAAEETSKTAPIQWLGSRRPTRANAISLVQPVVKHPNRQPQIEQDRRSANRSAIRTAEGHSITKASQRLGLQQARLRSNSKNLRFSALISAVNIVCDGYLGSLARQSRQSTPNTKTESDRSRPTHEMP